MGFLSEHNAYSKKNRREIGLLGIFMSQLPFYWNSSTLVWLMPEISYANSSENYPDTEAPISVSLRAVFHEIFYKEYMVSLV